MTDVSRKKREPKMQWFSHIFNNASKRQSKACIIEKKCTITFTYLSSYADWMTVIAKMWQIEE